MDFFIGLGIAVGTMLLFRWAFGGRWSRREFRAGDHYIPVGVPARSGCGHGQLVEVESGREIVAWLCPKCDKQLDDTDRAVRAHIDRKRDQAAKEKADREFRNMFGTPSYQDAAREEQQVRRAEIARLLAERGALSAESARTIINQEGWYDGGPYDVRDGDGRLIRHVE